MRKLLKHIQTLAGQYLYKILFTGMTCHIVLARINSEVFSQYKHLGTLKTQQIKQNNF